MKVILTESQVKELVCNEIAGAQNMVNPRLAYQYLINAVKQGLMSPQTAVGYSGAFGNPFKNLVNQAIGKLLNMNNGQTLQQAQAQEMQAEPGTSLKNNLGNWTLVSDDTLATVYNAVPQQCNKDVVHTASMFKLNLGNVLSQRVIAMERTFMKELGLKYGDVVYVEGTQKWDGPWQIQDTMNKRFAGMHKIDILVPSNIRTGKWDGVKIYVPTDQQTEMNAKSTIKGSA